MEKRFDVWRRNRVLVLQLGNCYSRNHNKDANVIDEFCYKTKIPRTTGKEVPTSLATSREDAKKNLLNK